MTKMMKTTSRGKIRSMGNHLITTISWNVNNIKLAFCQHQQWEPPTHEDQEWQEPPPTYEEPSYVYLCHDCMKCNAKRNATTNAATSTTTSTTTTSTTTTTTTTSTTASNSNYQRW